MPIKVLWVFPLFSVFPMTAFDGLVWLLLLVGPLLILQRSLHRETQSIFLLMTRRTDMALVLFSLLFFPGVLLHETSHYLMALLLGVRTGRFSLVPRPLAQGKVQLGYVETAKTDIIRDALIGTAPLLAGGIFVTYAGLARLGLNQLWDAYIVSGLAGTLERLPELNAIPDFWLWFYLVFVVSSTMLPSASDRRAWLPIGLAVGLLLVLALVAGAGPWLVANLAPSLNRAFEAVAVVLAISVFVHLVLLLPFYLIRRLLNRVTGLQVS